MRAPITKQDRREQTIRVILLLGSGLIVTLLGGEYQVQSAEESCSAACALPSDGPLTRCAGSRVLGVFAGRLYVDAGVVMRTGSDYARTRRWRPGASGGVDAFRVGQPRAAV